MACQVKCEMILQQEEQSWSAQKFTGSFFIGDIFWVNSFVLFAFSISQLAG